MHPASAPRRFGRSLLLAVLLLLAASSAFAAATTVFTDGEFFDADWSAAKYLDTLNNFSFTAGRNASGGASGAYRDFTHFSPIGPNSVGLAHLNAAAVYTPSVSGAITGLDFEFKYVCYAGGPSLAIAFPLCLKQGGTLYTAPGFLALDNGAGWQSGAKLAQQALDFTSATNTHPDFSVTGGPITFGFGTANGTGGATIISSHGGVDDWKVTVHSDTATPTRTTTWGRIKALAR